MLKSRLHILLTALLLLNATEQFAQKSDYHPYKQFGGEDIEILTLSNGKFVEFFDTDSIEIIGSAVLNTNSMKVIGYVQYDTMYSEATLEPEVVSRWLSRDPLASKFPYESPYVFVGNSPIVFVDPDGKEKVIVVGNQGGSPSSNPNHFLQAGLNQAIDQKTQGHEFTTLIVYKGDYSQEQLTSYLQLAQANDINFQVVENVDEIQSYVNTTGGITGDRKDDLISDFTFVGHGGAEGLFIGNGSGSGKRTISSDDIKGGYFSKNAFSLDSKITLNSCFSCNTNSEDVFGTNIGRSFSALAGDKVQGTPNFVNWGQKGIGSFTLNPGTFSNPQGSGVRTFQGTGGDNFDIRPDSGSEWDAPSDVG